MYFENDITYEAQILQLLLLLKNVSVSEEHMNWEPFKTPNITLFIRKKLPKTPKLSITG